MSYEKEGNNMWKKCSKETKIITFANGLLSVAEFNNGTQFVGYVKTPSSDVNQKSLRPVYMTYTADSQHIIHSSEYDWPM